MVRRMPGILMLVWVHFLQLSIHGQESSWDHFHDWLSLDPLLRTWKNREHFVAPFGLPICVWTLLGKKMCLTFEIVTSSSTLPLGDALGDMAYVRSQEPPGCIPDREHHEVLCLLDLTHHLLLIFVVWEFEFFFEAPALVYTLVLTSHEHHHMIFSLLPKWSGHIAQVSCGNLILKYIVKLPSKWLRQLEDFKVLVSSFKMS